jgi:hypothetical protein
MTSLKNGLPPVAKKKPRKGQPTFEQLKLSFDTTKAKLDEEMVLYRSLFSSVPLSSAPPAITPPLSDEKMNIELAGTTERREVLESVYELLKCLVGTEDVGICLSDSIGIIDVLIANSEKFLDYEEEKKTDVDSKEYRRSTSSNFRIGKLF